MISSTEQWARLGLLTNVTREVILESYRLDSCIATVRLLTEVGRHLGAEVLPIRVRACIFNKVVVDYLESHDNPDLVDAVRSEGGWSVGIGFGAQPTSPGKWPGHLVAIWRQDGEQYLIDPSVDQANRPEKQIVMTPICIPCPGEIHDESGVDAVFEWCSCLCQYRGDVTIPSHEDAHDWNEIAVDKMACTVMSRFVRAVDALVNAEVFGV